MKRWMAGLQPQMSPEAATGTGGTGDGTSSTDAAAAASAAAAATAAAATAAATAAAATSGAPAGGGQPNAAAAGTDDAAKAATEKAAADAEVKRKADEAAALSKAPDKYALTLPDGTDKWLDDSDLKSIEGLARAKGWTNEQAQTALNEHADALAAQSAAFRATAEADATYGGDKLQDTQRLAMIALDKVRPAGTERGDALRRVLNKTGYGNHIEVVSFLADLGKLMAEDGHVAGGSATPKKDAASTLYDKTPSA